MRQIGETNVALCAVFSRIRCGVLLISILGVVFATIGAIASETTQLSPIIVGSELDYPPYALVTEKGQADGFSVDLMKAVCDAMNIKVSFRTGTWDEVRKALERGEIDALSLVSYSKERDEVFDFTAPHTVAHGIILKRKGSSEIDHTSDLRGKSIVVMGADAAHDWLLRNDISRNLVITKTVAESLQLLASGKHDYAIAPRLVGLITAKELKFSNLEGTGPLLDAYGRGYGFAVKEGNHALLAQLNEGLSIIRTTGQYDKIYQKWFGSVDPKGVSMQVIIRYLSWGAAIIIVIGGVIFLWITLLHRTVRRQTTELRNAKSDLEIIVEDRTRELVQEIEDHQIAERLLREREKRYRSAVEGAHDGYFAVNCSGFIVDVNDSYIKYSGYSRDELLQMKVSDLDVADSDSEVATRSERIILSGSELFTTQHRKKTGEIWDIEASVNYSDAGEGQFICFFRDITARKQLENKLIQSKIFLDNLPDVAYMADDYGNVLWVNSAIEKVANIPVEDIIGKPFLPLFVEDDRPSLIDGYKKTLAGSSIENTLTFVSGSICHFSSLPRRNSDGEIVGTFGIARDISEQLRQETARRKSEMLYESAFRISPDAININRMSDGLYVDINEGFSALTGFTRDETIGRTSSELDIWVNKIDRERLVIGLKEYGIVENLEAKFRKKNKTTTTALMSARLIDLSGEPHILSITRDISERKLMENALRQAKEVAEIANRSKTVFLANMSHELRTPLTIINGASDIIALEMFGPINNSKYVDYARNAREGGEQLLRIVNDLLDIARIEIGHFELSESDLKLTEISSACFDLMKGHAYEAGLNITLEKGELPTTFRGEELRIKQILLNLLSNAIKFTGKGGDVSLKATTDPNGDVVFLVKDTGIGMDATKIQEELSQLGRSGNPFVREVQGAGIGLVLTKKFTEMHGGTLELESEVGVGTTATVRLPLERVIH